MRKAKLFSLVFVPIMVVSMLPLTALNSVKAVTTTKTLDVPIYNQNTQNPKCNTEGGNVGCVITSVAMIANYYGLALTPDDVVVKNGNSCEVNFRTIADTIDTTNKMNYEISYGRQGTAHEYSATLDEMYSYLRSNLDKGYPSILYYHDGFTYNWIHAIVAYGYEYDYSNGVTTFFVNDPAGGVKNSFTTVDTDVKKRSFHQMFVYSGAVASTPPPFVSTTHSAPADYDGDGKDDIALYETGTGKFFMVRSTAGYKERPVGPIDSTNLPASGDFDGDGIDDLGLYQRSTGIFYMVRSTAGYKERQLGPTTGDVMPAVGDYDGDGKDDIAMYQKSTSTFFMVRSTAGYKERQFGPVGGDTIPAIGDYDNDGKDDLTVFQRSTGKFFVLRSTAGQVEYNLGLIGSDIVPAPGDYDNDNISDIAVHQKATGRFTIARSTLGVMTSQVGPIGDTNVFPAVADYDGDGFSDPSVYKVDTRTFYLQRSTAGYKERVL